MQRLPTEIYDRIIHYVESLPDDPHVFDYLASETALRNLRLVDKTFSHSASRALFRNIGVRLSQLSSIWKFEAISSSEHARHVRFIKFNIEYGHVHNDFEEDDGKFFRLSDEAVDRLSSLLAEFRNLRAAEIFLGYLEPPEKAMGFVVQIITTIANLQFHGVIHNVTSLRAPRNSAIHLEKLLKNGNHKTAIQQFLQRIERLDFTSPLDIDHVSMGWINLDTLITSSPNLLSLTVDGGYWTFTPLIKIDSGPRLESLNLSNLKITSYHLLALLEKCKGSIRFISLHNIILSSGSWLHVLFQIRKNLNLTAFLVDGTYPGLEGLWRANRLLPEEIKVLLHAVGDIQRQTNVNRIAAGLEPRTEEEYFYLIFEPLEAVIERDRYEELNSDNWDAEDYRT